MQYIKPLNEYPTEPMSRDTSRLFFSLNINHRADPKGETPALCEIKEEFVYKVFEKRAAYYGMNVAPNVIAFLALAFPSPGQLVLFIHALYHGFGTKPIAFDELADLFPRGFPSQKTMDEAWDAQRLQGVGNLVDNNNCFFAVPQSKTESDVKECPGVI